MRIIQPDGHGEDAWRSALAACPALRVVRDEGLTHFNGFGDLLADVFQLLREPAPTWSPLSCSTFHERALRDLAALPEFQELRTRAAAAPDTLALATCVLGRQLSQHGGTDLLRALQAEAVGQAYADLATAGLKATEQLALRLGEGHPAVTEAKGLAQVAVEAAKTAFQAVERPAAEDARLSQLQNALQTVLRACAATPAQIGAHEEQSKRG